MQYDSTGHGPPVAKPPRGVLRDDAGPHRHNDGSESAQKLSIASEPKEIIVLLGNDELGEDEQVHGSGETLLVHGHEVKVHPSMLNNVILVSGFAGAGVLVRVALIKMFRDLFDLTLADNILTSVFVPNFVGCLIIGCMKGLKSFQKKYPSVHKGITTGFCGCLTTFSSLDDEISLLLIAEYPRLDYWIFAMVVFICVNLGGVEFGRDVFVEDPIRCSCSGALPENVKDIAWYWATCIAIIPLGLGVGLSFFFDDGVYGGLWMAVLIGPFGALMRYYLGVLLNKEFTLPIGTLTANVLGSAVLSTVNGLAWSRNDVGIWERAVMVGFCGSLTTVSSFMSEALDLRKSVSPKFSYIYIFLTLILGQFVAMIPNLIWRPSWINPD